MYWLLTGLCLPLVYATSRYHERRILKQHVSVSKLGTLPLPVLYLRCFYIERSRLRQQRHAVSLPAWETYLRAKTDWRRLALIVRLGLNPTRSGRGARLEQVTMRLMRMTNDVVGQDRACPLGSGTEYLGHITGVLDALSPGMSSPVMDSIPEDNLLVYLVRSCTLIRVDGLSLLTLAWQNYLPNARRQINEERTTTQAVLDQAEQGYIYLHTLVGMLFGLDRDTAELMAKLDVPNLGVHDRLLDVAADARHGTFQFSDAHFAERGIDPASLTVGPNARRVDLAIIPGMSKWMMELAAENGAQWRTELLPQLLDRVLPHIRPVSVRRDLERSWVERGASFARMEEWWRDHVSIAPYHRFPGDGFTPELYTRIMLGNPPFAEVLAEVARAFDVPVSPVDMERWRRGDAFAHFADVVLDTWEDRDAAWDVFEQAIYDPLSMACPTEGLRLMRESAIMLHNALAGLSSVEHVQHTALLAGRSAGEKGNASNIFRYVRAILTEDHRTAALFAFMMSDEARAHPNFGRFKEFFAQLTIIIGVYDSKVDFEEDFEAGRVAFKSNLSRRSILQSVFLWYGLKVLTQFGPVARLGATVASFIVDRRYPLRKEVISE